MANLDDMQRKIEGLLRKAERAGSPQEAEAFSMKAEALMLKYSIDHMMLGGKEAKSEEPIIRIVEIKGIYAKCSTQGLAGVVNALGQCAYWINGNAAKSHNGKVCGFESDVDQAIMLWNSLALQAANAMQHWAAERADLAGMSAFDKFKERRTFLDGFWYRAATRVQAAFAEVLEEAEVEYNGGAALALVDRKEKVNAMTPKNMRVQKDRTKMGSWGALEAGQKAAERADLGQNRVSENRKKLAQ
jgi:hypothetical protein